MAEMKLPPEAQSMLMQMQVDQQNLQGINYQKEMFKDQKMQVEFALTQLETAKSDVFKIAGPIMIKSDKDALAKELKEQSELITINLKKTEEQERKLHERMQSTQKKLEEMLSKTQSASSKDVDYEE